MARKLVDDYFPTLTGKRNRRRKTGETGPDDVYSAVRHSEYAVTQDRPQDGAL